MRKLKGWEPGACQVRSGDWYANGSEVVDNKGDVYLCKDGRWRWTGSAVAILPQGDKVIGTKMRTKGQNPPPFSVRDCVPSRNKPISNRIGAHILDSLHECQGHLTPP